MTGTQSKGSQTTRVLGWFALVAVVLLIALITYGVGGAVISEESAQRRLRDAQTALDSVLRLQLDEETGIRGFVATREQLFLDPYFSAHATFATSLGDLDAALARVGIRDASAIAELRALNAQWEKQVAAPQLRRPETGRAAVATQSLGKRLVDRFRAISRGLGSRLSTQSAVYDARARSTVVLLASLGIALAVVLGAILTLLFRRALASERANARELEREQRSRAVRNIAEAIPQLVWEMSADGRDAQYVNERWTRYTGLDRYATSNYGWADALHPEDRDETARHWEAALERIQQYESEHRLRSASGDYRWFLARATPIFDEKRALSGWFGTSTDIQVQKDAEEQLRALLQRESRASQAFQEAALPQTLPHIAGIDCYAVYRAGGNEALVGGDWYDAFTLLDGRVLFTIGDVLGSGVDAAVTMNAVRHTLRGAAQIFPDPISMLDAADRAYRNESTDGMVTAFVAIFDPVTMEVVYANAGHPPPLLRTSDGNVIELDAAPGLPIGLREKSDASEYRVLVVPPGSSLVSYTDGLIETTRDPVAGQEALADAVASTDFETVADPASHLVKQLADSVAADDVAVLVVRFGDPSANARRVAVGSGEWEIVASDAAQADAARAEMARLLRANGISDADITTAELVFTELIGNVLRHGGNRAEIRLDLSGELPVLHVLDRGVGFSYAPMLPIDLMSENGRGLFIITHLTRTFTVTPRPSGGSHARAVLDLSV